MFKFFQKFVAVTSTYDYRDKLISVAAVVVFLLMIVKMIIFPYGLFGFGETYIYTEGLVAKNGIQNINPLFVDYNEADREVSSLVFSGLMKYDPDKKAVVDDMATLTVNEEKTEYIFKLKANLKWHDGEPVTADDVFFTFHDIVIDQSFPNEILKASFQGVEILQLDESTIKFVLQKPNTFFVSNFVTGILPKHILEGTSASDILLSDFNKKPIGSGPYMVVDAVESFADGRTQVSLARSTNYYGELSEIELLRLVVYPTMEALIDEVNVVNGVVKVSGSNILDFVNNPRFKLIPYQLPQYTAIFMNNDSDVLKNSKVRLALLKSIDKDAYIGESLDKVRVDTPLMELEQGEWVYKPNVEEAQGALKDAGFKYDVKDPDHKGLRYDKDGNALQLNLIARLYDQGSYQFEESKKLITFLQNSWEKIGVSIQVEFLPQDVFTQRVSARKYDLLLFGQKLGYNLDTYSYWHSTQATSTGQNLSNYKSFQVDSVIEDVRSVFDTEKRKEKLKELAKKLKEDVPAIFIYTPIYYYATDAKVSGVTLDGVVFPSDRFTRLPLWRFSK